MKTVIKGLYLFIVLISALNAYTAITHGTIFIGTELWMPVWLYSTLSIGTGTFFAWMAWRTPA